MWIFNCLNKKKSTSLSAWMSIRNEGKWSFKTTLAAIAQEIEKMVIASDKNSS